MRKVPILVLALVTVLTTRAEGLELKNVRGAYGPLGATRPNARYLPGDILILTFDIEDLKVDPKTGVATYQQGMQITDDAGKQIFAQNPPAAEVPLFGGTTLPAFVQVTMTFDQKPGKYNLKVTITDKLAKVSREAAYEFELSKPAFGIVQPFTPAVGFVSQNFGISLAVTGMARDPKTKMPDVEVSMRLLDENGKPTVPTPITNNVRDLHVEGTVFDITKMSVIPMPLPFVLNRAGRFTIELQATDRLTKEQVSLRLPLAVIDPTQYLGKAQVGSGR